MNELKEALDNVVESGMKAIDRLSPEEIARVQLILEKVK